MLDGFLFRKIQPEFVLDLFMHVTMLDVRDVGIDHQSDQVQNEIGALAQDGECCETEILKTCIVRGLCATHAIDHLLAYLHGRRKWLWVTAQDITKVDCEQIRIKNTDSKANT